MGIGFVIHERLGLFCSPAPLSFWGGAWKGFFGPQTLEDPLLHQEPMEEKSYLPASFLDWTQQPPYTSSERRCLPASLRTCAFFLGFCGDLSMVDIAEWHPKEVSKWELPYQADEAAYRVW